MAYRIEFSGVAAKQFRKLDKVAVEHVKARIEELALNPIGSVGVRQRKGPFKGICRVGAGSFRILYQVFSKRNAVFVIAISDCKDIYQ